MFRLHLAAVLAAVLVLPAPGRAADLDPLIPADTTSYVSVNVRQILDAPLFKKQLLDPLTKLLSEAGDLNAVLNDLGFDPFKHLDRVTVSSPGGKETDRGLILAHGTFDLDKFRKKADEAARDNADVLKVHKVPLGAGKTHVVYEVAVPNQDASLYVALASNRLIIASPGKDYVVDALKAQGVRKKAELKNKDFQTLLERLDPKLSVAVASLGKALAAAAGEAELLPKGVAEALEDIEAAGGGLQVSNEVRLDVMVVGKNEKSAETLRETLNKGLKLALVGLALVGDENNKGVATLLEVVKTVRITGKGKVVGVSGTLTADVLQDFFRNDG